MPPGGKMKNKEAVIKANLNNCLTETAHLGIGNCKRGKVRDIYDQGDKLLLVTTDRQSAFDRILASVPFKGQVLNRVSAWWFSQTEHIVPNHVICIPHPNATLGKKMKVFPIEFVMRGYLTGSSSTSAWTLYNRGERNICGNILPNGMIKNMKFTEPLITPTTKSEEHDESITPEQIVSGGFMTKADWDEASRIAKALFAFGVKTASEHGLILVDTKYEMGKDEKGNIVLIDEIHTPDSSRYWLADGYLERLSEGLEPKNIDKEFLRLWFIEHCDPYRDEVLPEAPADLVTELSSRYITLFEMITGEEFEPVEGDPAQDLLKAVKGL
jgi:phosphoribosylaminoimidazole-succinocarboxamide synthase